MIHDFQHWVNDIAWVETPNAKYVVAGFEDGVVGMWQVVMNKDRCQVRLHWRTTNGVFNAQYATIQGVQGLNSLNKRILKQSRAVGEPAKDLSDGANKVFTNHINLPVKRIFELDDEDEGVTKRTRGKCKNVQYERVRWT